MSGIQSSGPRPSTGSGTGWDRGRNRPHSAGESTPVMLHFSPTPPPARRCFSNLSHEPGGVPSPAPMAYGEGMEHSGYSASGLSWILESASRSCDFCRGEDPASIWMSSAELLAERERNRRQRMITRESASRIAIEVAFYEGGWSSLHDEYLANLYKAEEEVRRTIEAKEIAARVTLEVQGDGNSLCGSIEIGGILEELLASAIQSGNFDVMNNLLEAKKIKNQLQDITHSLGNMTLSAKLKEIGRHLSRFDAMKAIESLPEMLNKLWDRQSKDTLEDPTIAMCSLLTNQIWSQLSIMMPNLAPLAECVQRQLCSNIFVHGMDIFRKFDKSFTEEPLTELFATSPRSGKTDSNISNITTSFHGEPPQVQLPQLYAKATDLDRLVEHLGNRYPSNAPECGFMSELFGNCGPDSEVQPLEEWLRTMPKIDPQKRFTEGQIDELFATWDAHQKYLTNDVNKLIKDMEAKGGADLHPDILAVVRSAQLPDLNPQDGLTLLVYSYEFYEPKAAGNDRDDVPPKSCLNQFYKIFNQVCREWGAPETHSDRFRILPQSEVEQKRSHREYLSQELELFRPFAVAMQRVLQKLPSMKGIFYRGANFRLKPEDHKGLPVVWGGFTSSSLNFVAANKFIDSLAENQATLFMLISNEARPTYWYSKFPDEVECVFPLNSSWEVVNVVPDHFLRRLNLTAELVVLKKADEELSLDQHIHALDSLQNLHSHFLDTFEVPSISIDSKDKIAPALSLDANIQEFLGDPSQSVYQIIAKPGQGRSSCSCWLASNTVDKAGRIWLHVSLTAMQPKVRNEVFNRYGLLRHIQQSFNFNLKAFNNLMGKDMVLVIDGFDETPLTSALDFFSLNVFGTNVKLVVTSNENKLPPQPISKGDPRIKVVHLVPFDESKCYNYIEKRLLVCRSLGVAKDQRIATQDMAIRGEAKDIVHYLKEAALGYILENPQQLARCMDIYESRQSSQAKSGTGAPSLLSGNEVQILQTINKKWNDRYNDMMKQAEPNLSGDHLTMPDQYTGEEGETPLLHALNQVRDAKSWRVEAKENIVAMERKIQQLQETILKMTEKESMLTSQIEAAEQRAHQQQKALHINEIKEMQEEVSRLLKISKEKHQQLEALSSTAVEEEYTEVCGMLQKTLSFIEGNPQMTEIRHGQARLLKEPPSSGLLVEWANSLISSHIISLRGGTSEAASTRSAETVSIDGNACTPLSTAPLPKKWEWIDFTGGPSTIDGYLWLISILMEDVLSSDQVCQMIAEDDDVTKACTALRILERNCGLPKLNETDLMTSNTLVSDLRAPIPFQHFLVLDSVFARFCDGALDFQMTDKKRNSFRTNGLSSSECSISRHSSSTNIQRNVPSIDTLRQQFMDALDSYRRWRRLSTNVHSRLMQQYIGFLQGGPQSPLSSLTPRAPLNDPSMDTLDRALSLIVQADKLRIEGKYNESFDRYTQALNVRPRLAEALVKRATLRHEHLGQYREALDDMTQVINISPSTAIEAYTERGHLLLHRFDDPVSALDDFTKAIHIGCRVAIPFTGRAMCYKKMRQVGEALSDLDLALTVVPAHTRARQLREELIGSFKAHHKAAATQTLKAVLAGCLGPRAMTRNDRNDISLPYDAVPQALNSIGDVLLTYDLAHLCIVAMTTARATLRNAQTKGQEILQYLISRGISENRLELAVRVGDRALVVLECP